LVTSDALEPRSRAVELPVSVGSGGIPADMRSGDRVDVWAVPDRTGSDPEEPARASRVLSGVRVVSRASTSGVSGGSGVTLVVDVAGTKLDATLMSALSTQRLTVVRVS
jgi:Flp pilus assembly protein CpaB